MPIRPLASLLGLAGCALLAVLPVRDAVAEADGPDFYRLTGLAPGETLFLHPGPEIGGRPLATLPCDAEGLVNFGCIGGMSYEAWQGASGEERAAAALTRWCRVGHGSTIAWAPGRHLAEGADTGAFDGGPRLASLAGTEWDVPRGPAAGDLPADADAFITFGIQGRASGKSWCNRFMGAFDESPGRLAFGPLAGTQMACPEPVMDAEAHTLRVFGSAAQMVATAELLALFDAQGRHLATLTRRTLR